MITNSTASKEASTKAIRASRRVQGLQASPIEGIEPNTNTDNTYRPAEPDEKHIPSEDRGQEQHNTSQPNLNDSRPIHSQTHTSQSTKNPGNFIGHVPIPFPASNPLTTARIRIPKGKEPAQESSSDESDVDDLPNEFIDSDDENDREPRKQDESSEKDEEINQNSSPSSGSSETSDSAESSDSEDDSSDSEESESDSSESGGSDDSEEQLKKEARYTTQLPHPIISSIKNYLPGMNHPIHYPQTSIQTNLSPRTEDKTQ
ncbi:uncharacterized protein MELLADRAFT_107584 [Melampsora larici-populina 98AG31]|uniref:Uncharacterized protein n=1 Tax=Melampsora larici-populina (strain 98AG31 / pathotype 3-4-7) TaxID=747676 RepID=F4RQ44_MELLP|nr:uncharacterized protein MELLADRAFT_107584 [Melampsora larici-populina 98AG31]EGG05346.1 hypothetical protein MELLADRAFT_107584 [Melampsora larici-populina 98AG31]